MRVGAAISKTQLFVDFKKLWSSKGMMRHPLRFPTMKAMENMQMITV